MFLASLASLANSGASGKTLSHALGLRVIPVRPPKHDQHKINFGWSFRPLEKTWQQLLL